MHPLGLQPRAAAQDQLQTRMLAMMAHKPRAYVRRFINHHHWNDLHPEQRAAASPGPPGAVKRP